MHRPRMRKRTFACSKTLIDLFIDVNTMTTSNPTSAMSATPTIADIARPRRRRHGHRRPRAQPAPRRQRRDGAARAAGGRRDSARRSSRGRPRRGANLRFAFVLPADDSPFLELVDRQIAQAAGDFRHAAHHRGHAPHRRRRPGAQFAAELAQVGDCEGIALMAPDLPPIKLAINELVRAGRARGDAVLRRRRLDARDLHRRRQPRRRPHRRPAARPHGERRAARHAAAVVAGDAALGRDRAPHRLRAGASRSAFPTLRMLRTARPARRRRRRLRRAAARFLQTSVDPARVAGLYNVGSGSAGRGARAGRGRPRAASVGVVAHDFTDAASLAAQRTALRLSSCTRTSTTASGARRACCAPCARTSAAHSTWCSRASRS